MINSPTHRLRPIPIKVWLSLPSRLPQALSAGDLEQLLAPIALYPDALLAQILAASTYPAQVAVADQWLQQMRAQGYGSPDQVAAGATAQTSWDPSVKALTAFPDVLDMLEPQPGVDNRSGQRLLQPAAGRDANRPGAAPAR